MKLLRDLVKKHGSVSLINKIKNIGDNHLARIADEELVTDRFWDTVKHIDVTSHLTQAFKDMDKYGDLFVSMSPKVSWSDQVINLDVAIKPVVPINFINIDVKVSE